MSPDALLKVDVATRAEPQAQLSDGTSSMQHTHRAVIFLRQECRCMVLIKAKCQCLVIIQYVFVNSPDGIFLTFVYLRTATAC